MDMKTVDQEEDAFPFSFSLPWLDGAGMSTGRRISDVKVGKGEDCISSLSSQRSMISEDHEPARPDDAFAGVVGAVVGLVKKEESFDCTALRFFCFDAPAVEVLVRGRLCGSREPCNSLKEA
jgi:hypothetical protein